MLRLLDTDEVNDVVDVEPYRLPYECYSEGVHHHSYLIAFLLQPVVSLLVEQLHIKRSRESIDILKVLSKLLGAILLPPLLDRLFVKICRRLEKVSGLLYDVREESQTLACQLKGTDQLVVVASDARLLKVRLTEVG